MLQSTQGSEERKAQEAGWRTRQIIEYISVGTYYNDHARVRRWGGEAVGEEAVGGEAVGRGGGETTRGERISCGVLCLVLI